MFWRPKRLLDLRPQTAVVMIGAKSSDDVLFLGASHLEVAAATGEITKLNGRTLVVDQDAGANARTEAAAVEAGGIVEFLHAPAESVPLNAATFHIVVAAHLPEWSSGGDQRLHEAMRLLRPGGRVILIYGEPKRGLLSSKTPAPQPPQDDVVSHLTSAGFNGARRLAESEGVAYYEARKPRD